MTIIFAILGTVAAPPLKCYEGPTQMDLNECAVGKFKAADAAMNQQWAITAKQMKSRDIDLDRKTDKAPAYFDTLLAGQRVWIKFRDLHCTSLGYGARGGSIEPMLDAQCRARLTRERTAQLADLIATN